MFVVCLFQWEGNLFGYHGMAKIDEMLVNNTTLAKLDLSSDKKDLKNVVGMWQTIN